MQKIPTLPLIVVLVCITFALNGCGNDRQAGQVANWWYDETPRGDYAGASGTYNGATGTQTDDNRNSVVAPPLNGNDNTIFSGQRR